MLSHHPLSRAVIRRIKQVYSVKKADRSFFHYQELNSFCRFLNELHSPQRHPVPSISSEEQILRQWAEDVIAPLCPTQAQRSKERKGLTWAARAQTSLECYFGYFGNWAYGSLGIRFIEGRPGQFQCSVQPGEGRPPFRGNRGISSTLTGITLPATREGEMALKLWDTIFLQEGFKRLKRCHTCEKWFVDKGKNRIAKFCGTSCTNRWWNKGRRLDSPNLGKRKKRRKGGAS